MNDLREYLLDLINDKLREILQLSDHWYDIYIFETKLNDSTAVSLRIASLGSPRINRYQDVNYITPPGTPREKDDYVEDSPRDDLCIYIHKYKNDFLNIFENIIKYHISDFIEGSFILKIHLDRLTIQFKYGIRC